MNNGIHVSFSILVSSGYMPRNGVAGSYGGFIPSWIFFLFFKKKPKKKKKKLGIKPPYDPIIPLLGINPEETKIENDTCVSHCSLQHYSQQLELGSNLDVHRQTNG